MKVKVISLPYIFQVLYVSCFTRPRYQVSVYRTIGPLVYVSFAGGCNMMMVFNFFHFSEIVFVCIYVATCDLVYEVGTVFNLC